MPIVTEFVAVYNVRKTLGIMHGLWLQVVELQSGRDKRIYESTRNWCSIRMNFVL